MSEKKVTKKVGKKRGPKPKIDEYYVNPQVFKDQIKEYYRTDYCIYELADSLKKIAYGLGNKSNFINYIYKDDYNPFSYFTTIAFHAFINRIKKEKKHHETLNQYKETMYEKEMIESGAGHVYVKPTMTDIDVDA